MHTLRSEPGGLEEAALRSPLGYRRRAASFWGRNEGVALAGYVVSEVVEVGMIEETDSATR